MMPVFLFVLAALLGAMLLSAAFVVWLAEVAMPLPVALLVVGVLYVAVAAMIYWCSLKASIDVWRARLDVVYKVSAAFDMVYRKIVTYIRKFVGDI